MTLWQGIGLVASPIASHVAPDRTGMTGGVCDCMKDISTGTESLALGHWHWVTGTGSAHIKLLKHLLKQLSV